MSARRLKKVAVVATLVMAALAASHELIYLLAHGSGVEYVRAMQEGGHDRYWTSFVLTVTSISAGLAYVGLRQIRRLSQQASLVRAGRLRVDDRGLVLLARLTARQWLAVAAGTLLSFLGQENLETVSAGNPLPGSGVVSGEHAVALPVIAVISLVVAFVAALVRWRRHVLLARLRPSFVADRRRAPRVPRPASTARPTSSFASQSHRLRAPPPRLLSST